MNSQNEDHMAESCAEMGEARPKFGREEKARGSRCSHDTAPACSSRSAQWGEEQTLRTALPRVQGGTRVTEAWVLEMRKGRQGKEQRVDLFCLGESEGKTRVGLSLCGCICLKNGWRGFGGEA